MKAEWERRRDHDFAVVKAQCQSLNFPEPELTTGGFRHKTKLTTLWRRFRGKEFFDNLERLGHTHVLFQDCSCR